MEGQAAVSVRQVSVRQDEAGRVNRRQLLRYLVDCPARVTILSGAAVIKGRLTDLSLGGCRMVTPEPISLGILARVEIGFELRGYVFRMAGVTAGTRAKRSFGMRFLEMSAKRAEALTELLEEIQRSPEGPQTGGRESVLPPMEQAEAEKRRMAEKSAAERQAGERSVLEKQEATVPAVNVVDLAGGNGVSESDGEAKPADRLSDRPSDRRTDQRHGVDTRVNLTLIRGAITMQGQIVNLSEGGCKLRTDEHFNVGIYTRVEAEFFLHGLPFRLAGVSQAIMDRHTIGIRFLDISERKRAQLMELIAEIEEMQGLRDGGNRE